MKKKADRLTQLEQILAAYRRSSSQYDPDEPWPRDQIPLAMHYLTATRDGAMSDEEYARRYPDEYGRIQEILLTPEEKAQLNNTPKEPSYFGRRRHRA